MLMLRNALGAKWRDEHSTLQLPRGIDEDCYMITNFHTDDWKSISQIKPFCLVHVRDLE